MTVEAWWGLGALVVWTVGIVVLRRVPFTPDPYKSDSQVASRGVPLFFAGVLWPVLVPFSLLGGVIIGIGHLASHKDGASDV